MSGNYVINGRLVGSDLGWESAPATAGLTVTHSERVMPGDRAVWRVTFSNPDASLRSAGIRQAGPSSSWMPVTAGMRVDACVSSITADSPGAGGGVQVHIDWRDKAGAMISVSSSAIFPVTLGVEGEQEHSYSDVAPVGAVRARLEAVYCSALTGTTDGYLTDLCIGSPSYVDGRTLFYRWAGEPDVSWTLASTEAATLADGVAPLLVDEVAFAGSNLVQAVAAPLEAVGAIARDVSLLTDPVRGPDETIRFQAMLRGLRGAYGESLERLRDRMVNPPSWEVGSTEAIAESVRGVLTRVDPAVPAYVAVRSNSDPATFPAYTLNHTTVVVRPEEALVADSVIQAAAEAGAPDWVVIHVLVGAGESIDDTTGTIASRTTPLDET